MDIYIFEIGFGINIIKTSILTHHVFFPISVPSDTLTLRGTHQLLLTFPNFLTMTWLRKIL